MIKASELRIGNKFECMGMIQTVFEILDNTDRGKIKQAGYEHLILCEENGNQYKPIEIQGIQLTEAWLRRFHTEEEIGKSVRFPNEITIYDRFLFIWKEQYKYWYVVTAYHKEYLTKIEFVHEYQNFIYTLMDIELTIKP